MLSSFYNLIFGSGNAALDDPYLREEDIYQPPNFSINDYAPVKVRCIGAGFSGLLCALRFVKVSHVMAAWLMSIVVCRLRQQVPNLDFKIYEKQAGVGGTWYANRYPVSTHYLCLSIQDTNVL